MRADGKCRVSGVPVYASLMTLDEELQQRFLTFPLLTLHHSASTNQQPGCLLSYLSSLYFFVTFTCKENEAKSLNAQERIPNTYSLHYDYVHKMNSTLENTRWRGFLLPLFFEPVVIYYVGGQYVGLLF
jgi:hypothetical protein